MSGAAPDRDFERAAPDDLGAPDWNPGPVGSVESGGAAPDPIALPTLPVAVKLASACVHAAEGLSPRGTTVDFDTFLMLFQDEDVQAYLGYLRGKALVPVTR